LGLEQKPWEQVGTSLTAGAFQHPVADALGRVRPSGARLTTNLELVRTRGI
jgi:hypothetical protein